MCLYFSNLPQSISTFKETQEKQSLFGQIFPSGQEMSHHEGIHIYNTWLGSKTLLIFPAASLNYSVITFKNCSLFSLQFLFLRFCISNQRVQDPMLTGQNFLKRPLFFFFFLGVVNLIKKIIQKIKKKKSILLRARVPLCCTVCIKTLHTSYQYQC